MIGKALTAAVLIVAIVIFLFLGSLRSVLVPLVAIPISLIGGIFLMQIFGFSINLLTLLAIVGIPKAAQAPIRPEPATVGRPLVANLNSAKRSRMRAGIGQPSLAWQPSSALA